VVVLLGAGLDAIVGLGVIATTPILGALLLGATVAGPYLAFGLWHAQRWAFRGTIVVQTLALLPLALVGPYVVLPKLVILGCLLFTRNRKWR